jgi:phospholipid/cholesterol/gamma-HCH transport system substrate-binding protein
MKKANVELMVGLFIIAGILALGYLSIKLGRMEIIGSKGYQVYADFPNIGGLKLGALVEIAGVEIGRVKSLSLNNYKARVVMDINPDIKLQDDTIVSIKTKGLLGEKYVAVLPGGSDEYIKPNGRIRDALPPVDIEDLISKFAFGKVEEK